MRYLLLIRHAQTQPIAGMRPVEFPLTVEGRLSCVPFAEEVAGWDPAVIVTSEAPKARETGEIIGSQLGLPVETVSGLEEHHRGIVKSVVPQAEFQSTVERIFSEPDQVVYGEESGEAALRRFSDAVERVLAEHPAGNIAVVTHGTVMALFVAAHNPIDAKTFWRRLQMPDLAVLASPEFTLQNETGNDDE